MTRNPRNEFVGGCLQFAGDGASKSRAKCLFGFSSVNSFSVTGGLAMKKWFKKVWKRGEEEGATMVEYGLMVALIALVCVGSVTNIGTALQTVFTNVAAAF
jgi:pilus assembly protein Flp/PilA